MFTNCFYSYSLLNNVKGQNGYQYSFRRGLIESISCTDVFLSEGTLQMHQDPRSQQLLLNDNRIFEGWKNE